MPIYSPKLDKIAGLEIATIAGGCFWGLEHVFRKYFNKESGLIDCAVGYCNGSSSARPNYKDVCTGKTGCAEAIQILYDPAKLPYPRLLEFFFRIHDPTQLDHQGPDRGRQYRSGVYTLSQQQADEAKRVVEKVQPLFKSRIVTEIAPLHDWWDAEDYHQAYLLNNPGGYECPTHYLRGKFGQWLTDDA